MSIKVSLVEDDARIQKVYAEWIGQSGDLRLVSKFGNAETALNALPKDQPEVVLMDINLPGRSGIECVHELKPLLPATQFVMVTVYEDADTIFEALSAGATGYILKQAPRNELLDAIRHVHKGCSPMSGSIARKVVQFFQHHKEPKHKTAELSAREHEVLSLLSRGYLYKEIADTLGVSYDTVTTYGRRIYEKLHVHSRAQAVAMLGKQ